MCGRPTFSARKVPGRLRSSAPGARGPLGQGWCQQAERRLQACMDTLTKRSAPRPIRACVVSSHLSLVWRSLLKCGVMLCFPCALYRELFLCGGGWLFWWLRARDLGPAIRGLLCMLVHQNVRLRRGLRLWQLGLLSPGPSRRLTETTSSIRRPTNLFAALRTVGQCRCCTSFGRCPWVLWFKPLGRRSPAASKPLRAPHVPRAGEQNGVKWSRLMCFNPPASPNLKRPQGLEPL